jgi:hypothetical protein
MYNILSPHDFPEMFHNFSSMYGALAADSISLARTQITIENWISHLL